ncbi:MAG TPA: MoaF N-terminal domain-containing protein [Sphingobium sp.]|nr:MoaF N-terminal domain-containing protein [Sphingobium sp.]
MGTPYPDVPLYRYPYTKLTEQQILARLTPKAKAGPESQSARYDGLVGQSLRIVTDGGPTLSYRFRSPTQLAVSEGEGRPIEAGYGALLQDHVLLITHLIPGTQRGYVVTIDQKTRLVTVFDLWFSGYQDKREAMRAIFFGYVDQPGSKPPAARQATTNRMEGKAFHWTQDTGAETLEFYASAAYSHFVELTRLDGKQGYCGPSDYVRISEELYIVTRTECEFSGIFTAYIVDLHRQEQAGMRLGFNGADELEYYLFRGKGEWLGQIAQFEPFGDVSGSPVARPDDSKGARRVYRPIHTMSKLTKEETARAAQKLKIFEARTSMAGNGSDPTDQLAGKSMVVRYDGGPAMAYQFVSGDTLRWRANDRGDWTEARYQAWTSMPGTILFGHVLQNTPDHESHMVVVDFDNGLATCFNGFLNNPYIANEAGARTLFGYIEMDGVHTAKDQRHARTDELLGHAISWNYSPGLTSMHLYSTPQTVSWIIFNDNGAGGMQWSGSGDFVKIRENLYFVYWLEEACNGSLGTILIDMRTMHDVGISYHCDENGLRLSQVGAHARHAGKFDIARFARTA